MNICMQRGDYRKEGGEKNSTLNVDQLKKEIEFLCLGMYKLSQPVCFFLSTSPKLTFCRCACRANANLEGNL